MRQPIPPIEREAPSGSILEAGRELPGRYGSYEMWRSGISFESACVIPFIEPPCYTGTKPVNVAPSAVYFPPYRVQESMECNSMTGLVDSELSDLLKQGLEAHMAWTISAAVYGAGGDATLPNHTDPANQWAPTLRSTATIVGTAAGFPHVEEAVDALLAAYYGAGVGGHANARGILHVPPGIEARFTSANMLDPNAASPKLWDGTAVSFGPGYDSGITGAPKGTTGATGTVWLYISGPVEYAWSELLLSDPSNPMGRTAAAAPANPANWSMSRTAAAAPANRPANWSDIRTNTWYREAFRWAIHRFDPCAVYSAGVAPTP